MFTIKPRGGGYVVLLTATNQPFGTYATERGAKIRVAELERKFGKKPQ